MYYSSVFDAMFTIIPTIIMLSFCFVIETMIFQGISYMNDKSILNYWRKQGDEGILQYLAITI